MPSESTMILYLFLFLLFLHRKYRVRGTNVAAGGSAWVWTSVAPTRESCTDSVLDMTLP